MLDLISDQILIGNRPGNVVGCLFTHDHKCVHRLETVD
jgi:hypothetical protein